MDSVFGVNSQSAAYDSTAERGEEEHMNRSFTFHTKQQLQQCHIIG